MHRESPTQLILTISAHGKGFPYPCCKREDGTNHGFILLKGARRSAAEIPEAADEPALRELLDSLNESDSAFISMGCEKLLGQDHGKNYKRGFIEFAIDSVEVAADAKNSFVVFYLFEQFLNRIRFNKHVCFHWELESNGLLTGETNFFSIACWITTSFVDSADDANATWTAAVEVLKQFVNEMKTQPRPGTPISSLLIPPDRRPN